MTRAGAEDVDAYVIRPRVVVRADPGRDRILVAVRDQCVYQPVARLARSQEEVGGPETAWCDNTCLDKYFNVSGPASAS